MRIGPWSLVVHSNEWQGTKDFWRSLATDVLIKQMNMSGAGGIARETEPVRQVIVDARAIRGIDVTAAEQLQAFVERLHERGIRFVVAKAHLPLREAAKRMGLRAASEAGKEL